MTQDIIIKKAVWPDDAETLRKIREAVFVIEQGVSSKIEWDGLDHLCQHSIAYNSYNEPIGTGRIKTSGHIGRISVLSKWRSQGVGKAIIKHLIQMAEESGLDAVYLNAQIRALDFYRRQNFKAEGPVFMEAGIPHQRMRLNFKEQ